MTEQPGRRDGTGGATPAPSLVDAERAAAVLVGVGVSRVVLFGSVARGDQGSGSDIDLVAIYNDLDYRERDRLVSELGKAAGEAAGCPVDVVVTDRPEWRIRTRMIQTSMERHIAGYGRVLVNNPPAGVDWEKEVWPSSDLEEAVSVLLSVNGRLSLLRSYLGGFIRGRRESPKDPDGYQTPMLWACAAAHAAIVDSVRVLIHVAAVPGTSTWGKNKVRRLCDRLPQPHRTAFPILLTPPGSRHIDPWHQRTIPDWWGRSRPGPPDHPYLPPVELVEALAWAAYRAALYADKYLPPGDHTERLGWTVSSTRSRLLETLEENDLRTGRRRKDGPWDHFLAL